MDLVEFIRISNDTENSPELVERFIDYLERFGISQFMLLDLSLDPASDKRAEVLASHPEGVQVYYLTSRKFEVESVYEKALQASVPFLWKEVKRNDDSRIFLKVSDNLEETASYDGIGVTIHQPMGRIIGVAFSGLRKDIVLNKDTLSHLHAASNQFYHVYTSFRNNIAYQGGAVLTEREREVLQWIARGKSKQETADLLSVTESTVKRHCENIFTKLNVKNLPAAVAKAIKSGLITYFWIFELFV